ncbi:MAG: hypothetical protein EP336_12210 [Rhodobacteraceae bacterium]|nr:MAG: hypothetical protein EP336_12210 [Paracoccaceae bacterium]
MPERDISNRMNIVHMKVVAGKETAKLRIAIPDLPEEKIEETWFCSVPHVFGATRGAVAWQGGRKLGLFAMADVIWDKKLGYRRIQDGVTAYGVLDIPEEGLLSVGAGEGDRLSSRTCGVGHWVLERKETKDR